MKVQKISIKNFKLLEDVDIAMEGKSIIVLGPNNVGKSSLIDAVFDTLQNGEMPGKPIRNGAEKGEIVVEVGEGKTQYIVKKSFTAKNEKGYLSISTPDGATYTSPVSHLNNLFGTISLDLEGLLSSKDDKEVAKKLKAFIGIDTSDLEAERKGLYDERATFNKEVKMLEPLIKGNINVAELIVEKELNEKIINDSAENLKKLEVIKERKAKGKDFIENQKNKIQSAEVFLEKYKTETESAKKRIKQLKAEIEQLENGLIEVDKAKILQEKIKAESEKTLETAKTTMAEIEQEETSLIELTSGLGEAKMIIQQVEYAIEEDKKNSKLIAKVEALKVDSEKRTADMLVIDNFISKRFKDAGTEEIQFSEDGILFNGLPLEKKQINTAGLAKLALDLAIKSNPKLHAVRFDASFMDNNTFAECVETINKAGFQAFVEMVDKNGKELQIVLEEELKPITE